MPEGHRVYAAASLNSSLCTATLDPTIILLRVLPTVQAASSVVIDEHRDLQIIAKFNFTGKLAFLSMPILAPTVNPAKDPRTDTSMYRVVQLIQQTNFCFPDFSLPTASKDLVC